MLGGFFGLVDQFVILAESVSAHIELHFLGIFVVLKQHAIEDVLQVEQRLALAANESLGIIGCLEVEHLAAFCHFFLDGHLVAEVVQQGLE